MNLSNLGVAGIPTGPLSRCPCCFSGSLHINADFCFGLCHFARCGTASVRLQPPNSQLFLQGQETSQLVQQASTPSGAAAAAQAEADRACSDFNAASVMARTSEKVRPPRPPPLMSKHHARMLLLPWARCLLRIYWLRCRCCHPQHAAPAPSLARPAALTATPTTPTHDHSATSPLWARRCAGMRSWRTSWTSVLESATSTQRSCFTLSWYGKDGATAVRAAGQMPVRVHGRKQGEARSPGGVVCLLAACLLLSLPVHLPSPPCFAPRCAMPA